MLPICGGRSAISGLLTEFGTAVCLICFACLMTNWRLATKEQMERHRQRARGGGVLTSTGLLGISWFGLRPLIGDSYHRAAEDWHVSIAGGTLPVVSTARATVISLQVIIASMLSAGSSYDDYRGPLLDGVGITSNTELHCIEADTAGPPVDPAGGKCAESSDGNAVVDSAGHPASVWSEVVGASDANHADSRFPAVEREGAAGRV